MSQRHPTRFKQAVDCRRAHRQNLCAYLRIERTVFGFVVRQPQRQGRLEAFPAGLLGGQPDLFQDFAFCFSIS